MKPWLDTFRKKLAVRGRQGMKVTVIVTVYRGTVWVSIDPLFAFEAILEPEHVASLIDMCLRRLSRKRRATRMTTCHEPGWSRAEDSAGRVRCSLIATVRIGSRSGGGVVSRWLRAGWTASRRQRHSGCPGHNSGRTDGLD
jgi:hypothetical protein